MIYNCMYIIIYIIIYVHIINDYINIYYIYIHYYFSSSQELSITVGNRKERYTDM